MRLPDALVASMSVMKPSAGSFVFDPCTFSVLVSPILFHCFDNDVLSVDKFETIAKCLSICAGNQRT